MKKYILSLLMLIAVGASVGAQEVNTLYFMDNVSYRNRLNPAFQPYSNFYLGLPLIGNFQFGLGNNNYTLRDLVYKKDGQLITFLHPKGSVDDLYKLTSPLSTYSFQSNINLWSFGFRRGKGFWNIAFSQKTDGVLYVPKDFMRLILYGTPDLTGENVFDLHQMNGSITSYTELAVGYSRKTNDRWTFGGNLKLLLGTGNVSYQNTNMDLTASVDKWTLKGNGNLRVSLPGTVVPQSGFPPFDYTKPKELSDLLSPVGMGGGLDVGVVYKPSYKVTLSAAVTDLGFIRWNKNIVQANYSTDYSFNGMKVLDVNNNIDFDKLTDSIRTALENSITTLKSRAAYTTYISPKVNIGMEYNVVNNLLTLGLLSHSVLRSEKISEEITASVNLKPIDWFNFTTSYSILNGRAANFGAGMAVRTGFLNWFLATDYIPLHYAKTKVSGTKVLVPYATQYMNFAFGVNIMIGNRKDDDKDGVINRKDKCPETPYSVVVDMAGCPLDTDGDGVPDYLDKCQKTPPEAYNHINQIGCPVDWDGDGVPDYLDKCPDTPKEANKRVDKNGCALDADKDGIPDYKDKCPDTPTGVRVDSLGCPLDTDGDGVADYKDKCPGTPAVAHGMVDSTGCPLDSDGDGVYDYLDLCPNTPAEARQTVDKNGCSKDSDGDGVPDYLDKCPGTPAAARGSVDEKGCPRDTDGDGVPDYQDNCPKVPGVVWNKGCPELKKEVRALFRKALQGIQFETAKFVIKPVSYRILNQVAKVLNENQNYIVEIQGHTDNVGNSARNMTLSDNRAKAVMTYLINKGVSPSRMTAKGYGDTMPVTSNKTAKGRSTNRRVEFVVTFEQIVSQ